MLELFDTQYGDCTAKHFHEKLVDEFGYGFSCNWLRTKLQDEGRIRKAMRRGAHRRKRPQKPMPGMLLHQDGSTHEWVPGERWDLIWTMDDATNETCSGFLVAEEGTMSGFRGIAETIMRKGLFCSLYVDRGSHYWHTAEAGGKVGMPTPGIGRQRPKVGTFTLALLERINLALTTGSGRTCCRPRRRRWRRSRRRCARVG